MEARREDVIKGARLRGAVHYIIKVSFGWQGRRARGGGKKDPTVGRRCDLLWVVIKTYCRFFRRPTVGRFLALLKVGAFTRGKGGCL